MKIQDFNNTVLDNCNFEDNICHSEFGGLTIEDGKNLTIINLYLYNNFAYTSKHTLHF